MTGIPNNMKGGTSRVCPDYDVWSETMENLHRLPITVAIEHVNGQAIKPMIPCILNNSE
jgi:hypothetical protein